MNDLFHYSSRMLGSSMSSSWIDSSIAFYIALGFCLASVSISLFHIFWHLRNYSMPQIQRYVIRILFICPIYACSSLMAISLGSQGAFAEVFRDIYESFVIYSFYNLILEYCGGESDCIYQIENENRLKFPFPFCWLPSRPKDARLMRFCSRGVLQFVVIKIVMAIIIIIALLEMVYYNENFDNAMLVVYNISYAWALYCLYVFYLATAQLIQGFRPVSKFLAVKSIIFATYYQSLLVRLIPISSEEAYKWNDFILCIEMIGFSVALMFAFPVSEFIGGIPDRHVLQNVKDVLTVKDIYQDVYHNFMPTYRDYALQRSQNEAPETVRLRTFFAGNLDSVALEMTERYRGRSKRMAFNSLLRSCKRSKFRKSTQEGASITVMLHNSFSEVPFDSSNCPVSFKSIMEEFQHSTTVSEIKNASSLKHRQDSAMISSLSPSRHGFELHSRPLKSKNLLRSAQKSKHLSLTPIKFDLDSAPSLMDRKSPLISSNHGGNDHYYNPCHQSKMVELASPSMNFSSLQGYYSLRDQSSGVQESVENDRISIDIQPPLPNLIDNTYAEEWGEYTSPMYQES